jgi:ribosomal protein S18 acetylase RimI-like enzyme
MTLRPATDGDREAVLALGVAEEVAWFGEAEHSAEEVGEWVDDEGGVAPGAVAVDAGGTVRGFASPGRHQSVFLADPAWTDPAADTLLPWLLDRRDRVELMAFADDPARLAAFDRHGLRHRRSTFSLVRDETAGPLPGAVPPDGIEIAPHRVGDDDEAVHRLIYVDAAWASVPGHVERDLAAWRESVRRCASVFLARRDGDLVGWVAGRVVASGRGYVEMLAVAASERGRGVGRALLLRAFADLQRAGARGLALAVQAGNESALGLYRSVGLEIEQEWRIYATT